MLSRILPGYLWPPHSNQHVQSARSSASSETITLDTIAKRINIPYNASSPAGLIEAETRDPWVQSGKYALGWTYFCIVLLVLATAKRFYYLWEDKMRLALNEEEQERQQQEATNANHHLTLLQSPGVSAISLASSHAAEDKAEEARVELDLEEQVHDTPPHQDHHFLQTTLDTAVALTRYIAYRPLPIIHLRKGWRPIVLPPLPFLSIITAAIVFNMLYIFVPQPLYWISTAYGSPPLAIRSGMLAVALLPWVVALSMKANLITMLTGLGHERLNVLHRWGGWLCVFLGLVHTIPFYVTPIWETAESVNVWTAAGWLGRSGYVYGSGIAALIPLLVIGVQSLPQLRHLAYNLFVLTHIPLSILLLSTLFWHCSHHLSSPSYLYATASIWAFCTILRITRLNWTNPWRLAYLIGDDATITLLAPPSSTSSASIIPGTTSATIPAIKVQISTRKHWSPGQYIYLRLPTLSLLSSHPFTISSLCDPALRSAYAPEGYRDLTLIFRPSGGFTHRVLAAERANGPAHTYRAFVEGPYGGVSRALAGFDVVVLVAGGSGITAVMGQLVDLVGRMREQRAVTRKVVVVWAMKRRSTLAWCEDELAICMSALQQVQGKGMQCKLYATGEREMQVTERERAEAGVAVDESRAGGCSPTTDRQDAAFARALAQHLEQEKDDVIAPLPPAHFPSHNTGTFAHVNVNAESLTNETTQTQTQHWPPPWPPANLPPQSPQHFQLPPTSVAAHPHSHSHSRPRITLTIPPSTHATFPIHPGRPDIPTLLAELSQDFGDRNAVFVCGPPGLRRDVAGAVAGLQRLVWKGAETGERVGGGGGELRVREVWLHGENFAL